MTDPLSVSASIAGLVTLADIVFGRIYQYVKGVKKAQKEISALSAEIGAIYGILSNLHLLSRQLEHERAESTMRIHHIHSCYQTLEHVKSILDRADTSSLRDERLEGLKRKLGWPFTSSEVKNLITEIERHKSTLGLALNVDCMSGLIQALSKHDEIRNTIEGMRTELKERHEAETRIAVNKERKDILNSFTKVNPRSNLDMSRKLRSPGTGLWLTEGQEFRQWLETKNARLWFYGIPGAGKTVLASSVIDEAFRASNPSTAVAFFYCDYKDAATQDLSNILGSLVQQFAKQDEESFAKLRNFYEAHNPEHQLHCTYDPEALLDLVRTVTSVFDCAMIIIDGLDECGMNTPLVVESLITLNDGEGATVKTILLSRDEIEIRERLENYIKVSIAARSSDLRLYVGAEIDLRMRKKRLRIRDQTLKEHILEKLVDGADGMFRWVACQMDYLCELPNDDARRKALGSLPPDLNATYERILSRVNQSNPETQKLVRRALRWIANANGVFRLTTEALCEAVSINFGDTKRNSQAISGEFEVLHWCSSLVRKSSNGRSLELAHFTVKEYLQQIEPGRDISVGAYQLDPRADEIILAKVYLTYLNFEDFDERTSFDEQIIERRNQEYPFRRFATMWIEGRSLNNFNDDELFSLAQKLFDPSKPNTLISLMLDLTISGGYTTEEERLGILRSGFAESTALHFASMLGLRKLCSWLIKSGCDINRNSAFGTPLHCALLGLDASSGAQALEKSFDRLEHPFSPYFYANKIVDILLEAGADPNSCFHRGTEELSPLYIALQVGNSELVVQLLEKGGVLNGRCLDLLENCLESEGICEVIESARVNNVQLEHRGRLLQLVLRAETSNVKGLMQKDMDLPHQKKHYEQTLHAAAEFGQTEVVRGLLEDQELDVDAADESTGRTALHYAVRTDQLGVAQILMNHGADSSKTDSQGRTSLHHSVWGKNARCLQRLLHRDTDTSVRDLEGMTMWHLAAQEGNVQALSILLNESVDAVSAIGLKAKDGRTPFLCASASGSKEAVTLLLSAGSSLSETALDGISSLHYAAKSGSLETVELLIEQAVDLLAVTDDGSTALHYAVSRCTESNAGIVRTLLEKGADPRKAREDGCMPLHDVLRKIKELDPSSPELGILFAVGQTLLKSLLEKSRLALDLILGSELIYLACSHSFPNADETVAALLELGLDCNIVFDEVMTALMAAAEDGKGVILSTLLRHGADPCVADSSGLTALHHACFNGHMDVLVRLRETSIDWNSRATTTVGGRRRETVTALHIAAQTNETKILEYLLNEGLVSDINARTDSGKTPLWLASWARESRNVSLLLSNGADPTPVDAYGESAIHSAACDGCEDVISEFIRSGSDLGLSNSLRLTPELLARKYGHEGLAKTIMNYIIEQNDDQIYPSDRHRPERTQVSSEALKLAIELGDLELCSRLIESDTYLVSGFDGCMGCTPLLYSLHKGQPGIAEHLASHGASIAGSTCEAWVTRGFTAFHYAAAWGYVELLRLLLEKAPSEIYTHHDPIHPVHLAVLKGDSECVKSMLDHVSQGRGRSLSDQGGTLLEALDWMVNMQVQGEMLRWSWYGISEKEFPDALKTAKPLHIATYMTHLQIARMLLDYGASVDIEDGGFATPLHYAASNGQTAMVQLLLDAGANPNALDSKLVSPCMKAVEHDKLDALRVLLKGGADIRLRRWDGGTALQRAAACGAKDVFAFLMKTATKQDFDAEDVFGLTVLYDAICQTSALSMSFVLSLVPQTLACEPRSYSILNAAIQYRSSTEVKMLLRQLPTDILSKLLNHRAQEEGTPLYNAAILSKTDTIKLLIDTGAQLELDGSDHGTPLMAACTTGRLAAVKVLVARGAKTSYVKDGQVYSVLTAAKHHPQVRRWLLVGRFLEGPKLLMDGVARQEG